MRGDEAERKVVNRLLKEKGLTEVFWFYGKRYLLALIVALTAWALLK